jgi:hypothetical protein
MQFITISVLIMSAKVQPCITASCFARFKNQESRIVSWILTGLAIQQPCPPDGAPAPRKKQAEGGNLTNETTCPLSLPFAFSNSLFKLFV